MARGADFEHGDGSTLSPLWDCIPLKCGLEGTWILREMARESRDIGKLSNHLGNARMMEKINEILVGDGIWDDERWDYGIWKEDFGDGI